LITYKKTKEVTPKSWIYTNIKLTIAWFCKPYPQRLDTNSSNTTTKSYK
jgi:hypothetical protein